VINENKNFKFFLVFFLICVSTTGTITPSDAFGNSILAFLLLLLWSFPLGILGVPVLFFIVKELNSHQLTSQGLDYGVFFLFASIQFFVLDKKYLRLRTFREKSFVICFAICGLIIFWRIYVMLSLYFKPIA
jgi:hypothetical protein